MGGTLYVVATPIGNLEDITLRALRILGEVDLILAEDTRRTAGLLAHHRIRTRVLSFHQHNEEKRLGGLLARLESGERLALVSDAGTPTVSDPGTTLVAAAHDRGIRVEPVPGPSAVLAALSVSGFGGDTFTFAGFPPRRAKDREPWLRGIADSPQIHVFFEAPHRLRGTLTQASTILGDRPIFVARELTKVFEELVKRPSPDEARAYFEHPRGEFVVVVAAQAGEMRPIPPLPKDALLQQEFGELTNSRRLNRRGAIRELARRHQVSARKVYAALERAKNLAEDLK